MAVENRRPPSDDIMSKNSPKKFISLTSWDPSNHISALRQASARVRESSARQEEKKRGGVGGGKQERKRGGEGGGKARKKEGGVGGGRTKNQGGVGGWVGDDVIKK